MNLFRIGDTWREKGRRGRAVVITSAHSCPVRVVFQDSKREVGIMPRTLLKYFTREPRS